MQAGKLRKRITFLSSTADRDAYGANNLTWNEVCTVWASLRPLSGRQLALAQASTITSTATHEIRIRYRPDLRGKLNYRIRYNGPSEEDGAPRYYRINSILDTDEDHSELRITATEVTA